MHMKNEKQKKPKEIKYSIQKWIICVNLKSQLPTRSAAWIYRISMFVVLVGQPCFFDRYWVKKEWFTQEKLEVGKENVIIAPLFDQKTIDISAIAHQAWFDEPDLQRLEQRCRLLCLHLRGLLMT